MPSSGIAYARDVEIFANDLTARAGLPLICVMRNERLILPDFLEHYRNLGVQRFFILDDVSDDGTREFLTEQGDVCTLVSSHRYGDRPAPDTIPAALQKYADLRMIHIWRTGLMNRFCADQWALQCDADEFLCLPEGMKLPAVITQLEDEGAKGAWGGMIDLYPRTIADFQSYPDSGFTFPKQDWYFDGVRHFSLRRDKPPRHHYIGVRHRLDVAFLQKPDMPFLKKMKLRFLGRRKSPSGTLVKPILQKWDTGQSYLNSHHTTLQLSEKTLLPLLHYRYAPSLLSKLEWAPKEGGYSKGNADYLRVDQLVSEMRRQDASFMGPHSIKMTGYESLAKTGNASLDAV